MQEEQLMIARLMELHFISVRSCYNNVIIHHFITSYTDLHRIHFLNVFFKLLLWIISLTTTNNIVWQSMSCAMCYSCCFGCVWLFHAWNIYLLFIVQIEDVSWCHVMWQPEQLKRKKIRGWDRVWTFWKGVCDWKLVTSLWCQKYIGQFAVRHVKWWVILYPL